VCRLQSEGHIRAKTDRNPPITTAEIPSAVLAEYTNSAHGWDDTVANEMRYFLPRYLELIANGDIPDHTLPEKCLRRLAEAAWRTHWPEAEVEVLDQFFDAYIVDEASHLSRHDTSGEWFVDFGFDQALLLAISAGADVDRLFAALWSVRDPAGAVHLAHQRMYATADEYRLEPDVAASYERLHSLLFRPDATERISAAARSTHNIDFLSVLQASLELQQQ
jgi:hypothetical protein